MVLVEFQRRSLGPGELSEHEARMLHVQFGDKITVEWPTPKTDHMWQLTSLGWVGFVPLGPDRGVSLQPEVPLRNLFAMLEYAYDLPSFKLLEGLYESDSILEFFERLAVILSKRLLQRARKSLYKAYTEESAAPGFVRGRIDVGPLMRTAVRSRIPCSYEEHTIDIEDNRIVAWTMHTILRSGVPTQRSVPILRKAERVLRNSISLKPYCHHHCVGRTYSRLNCDYEILHKLCRFFLENTGPTQNLGDRSMIPFMLDMARLFELFVARWLELHLDKRYRIKKQEGLTIGGKGSLRMIMDLLICDARTARPLCVLDTKYKAHNTVSPADYNQVVAYADATGCENAILIYPGKLEHPFDEKPGTIRVKAAVFDIGADLSAAGEAMLRQLYDTVLEA